MTHPLTDRVCDKLTDELDQIPRFYGVEDCMRSAADWQLEQVLKFMEEHEQLFGGSGMIFILKDAMRPQETP